MFEMLFGLAFWVLLINFVLILVRNLSEWNRNNHCPVLTVQAKVAAKRSSTSLHSNAPNQGYTPHTVYYATFQVESGDRMELRLSGREYGLLAEGDKGRLTFQGSRFRSFERQL